MPNSLLRTDLLPESLTEEQTKIIVHKQFTRITETAIDGNDRLRAPEAAKNLNEFYGLVNNVIQDYERRLRTTEDAKVYFCEDFIDFPKDPHIVVSFGLVKRLPGAFGKGKPFEADVVNMRPVLREILDDIENPGYKRAILGYWHDNEIRFTIWSRSNKEANEKALWFEEIMQEYSWYFVAQGTSRVIFLERQADFVKEINGVKLYGRPIHYYVRTETLSTVSEKALEQIVIDVKLGKS